jgi:fructose-1,6-bisphosphatase/inositol monophosphatase family enzyme
MKPAVAPEAAIIGASLPIPGQVKTVPRAHYDRALMAVIDTAAGVRRLGSAALSLCYVAAGRHDAFFEDGLSPLDYAAAVLVVREAGGLAEGGRAAHAALAGTAQLLLHLKFILAPRRGRGDRCLGAGQEVGHGLRRHDGLG